MTILHICLNIWKGRFPLKKEHGYKWALLKTRTPSWRWWGSCVCTCVEIIWKPQFSSQWNCNKADFRQTNQSLDVQVSLVTFRAVVLKSYVFGFFGAVLLRIALEQLKPLSKLATYLTTVIIVNYFWLWRMDLIFGHGKKPFWMKWLCWIIELLWYSRKFQIYHIILK